MNKNYVLGGLIIVALLLVGVLFFTSEKPKQEVKVEAGKTSPYLEFNTQDYDTALQEDKFIVLNFYANWCPICRAEKPEWERAFNELSDENVIGFRVNYNDSDTDQDEKNLAKEFDITYQHTKVFLKKGKQELKVTDQWDKEQIISQINKYK